MNDERKLFKTVQTNVARFRKKIQNFLINRLICIIELITFLIKNLWNKEFEKNVLQTYVHNDFLWIDCAKLHTMDVAKFQFRKMSHFDVNRNNSENWWNRNYISEYSFWLICGPIK